MSKHAERFFPGAQNVFPPAAFFFVALSAVGCAGVIPARLCTTSQVWVPTGLRGACPGSSKSRIVERDHGEAFRHARAKQDDGNPTILDMFSASGFWLLLLLLYHV